MALTELIFGAKTRAQVGVVQFDCSLSETHSSEATITEHPVEEGADITDHIRLGHAMIDLNGLVTNTPLIFLASLQNSSPLVGDIIPVTDRVNAAYRELQRVMRKGETVDVVTSLDSYENMAITAMSVARDAANGQVLNCSLSLREIIIAVSETVEAPIPVEVAKKKPVNKGKKTKTGATAGQSSKAQGILKGLIFG